MYYSASTGGFYEDPTKPNFPADAKEISDELYYAVAINRPPEKIVVADENGYPMLADPPPPTSEEFLIMQSAKLKALVQLASSQKASLIDRISTISDAVEFEEATQAEVEELPVRQAQLTEWKRYAILLGRVTTQAGWHTSVDWPAQPANGMDLTVSAVAPQTS